MAELTSQMSDFWADAEVIHRYTRAEAIRDGVLVDVTATGAEAGIRVPVALTAGLHAEAVAWNESNAAIQDEAGRLWDVLTVTRYAIAHAPEVDRTTATVHRVPNTPKALNPKPLPFTVHIGPGDAGEPVITLMLPTED